MIGILNKVLADLKDNPGKVYLYLLPFLALYCTIILTGYHPDLRKDEWRYIYYAENLLQGFYSPADTVFLWNGPGYPLLLVPFVGLGLPYLYIKLLNAIFLYLSLIFLFKTLRQFFDLRLSFWITLAMGIYLPGYEMLKYMMTELFSIFLITLFLYFVVCTFKQKKQGYMLASAITLAWLTLTKVIFGYVIVLTIICYAILFFIKKRKAYTQILKILVISILLCFPYLLYTYSLTGKIFYWSNAGGMQLYWMSTPYKGEYGDWINFISPTTSSNEEIEKFRSRHGPLIANAFKYTDLFSGINLDSLVEKSNMRQDELFRKAAVENIKNHPGKYIENWISNTSRMLFNVPYSYKRQNNIHLILLLFHVPAIYLIIFTLTSFWRKKIQLPISAVFLAIVTIIYLGGSSLVSAYPRQLYILFPVLLFILSFGLERIHIKPAAKNTQTIKTGS